MLLQRIKLRKKLEENIVLQPFFWSVQRLQKRSGKVSANKYIKERRFNF